MKTLVVAVFAKTSDQPGKAITYDQDRQQFTAEDLGHLTAQELLNYDAQGQVVWAQRGFHDWVHEFAVWERSGLAKAKPAALPSHPTLLALSELGFLVQELALINQDTNRPSREAAAKLAARCSSLSKEVDVWRVSHPNTEAVTVKVCDCTTTLAGAIAAIMRIDEDTTDRQITKTFDDYQASRVAFSAATGVWYEYVERMAASEGVVLTYGFR